MFNDMRARGITLWEQKLKYAKQQLYNSQEQTPDGQIANRKQSLEELQERNANLTKGCFGFFNRIFRREEIESNRLEIANLEEEIEVVKWDYEWFKKSPELALQRYRSDKKDIDIGVGAMAK